MAEGSGDANNDEEGGSNWTCCNDEQTLFVLLYLAFACLALVTWNSIIAKPMRLIAVFLHEMSHAVACWMTGGDVYNIEVYTNEGGVTKYAGGCRSLIIPAGYVGCSIWAMVFVVLSGGRKTATFAAGVFCLALLAALCYSPNAVLVGLNLTYALLTLLAIYIEWFVFTPIIQFVILFYGVLIGMFAIADIHADTISRTVEHSDAYACHQEVSCCYCCPPRCIGLQWVILALCFQFCAMWVAVVEMSDECMELNWFQCLNLSIDSDGFNVFDFSYLEERNFNFGGFWEQKG